MVRFSMGITALAVLLFAAVAQAEDRMAGQQRKGGRAALWTAIGAGAGFGLGIWAGLTVFDDAIDSDRKVWTTAILSSAAGGTIGYLVGRRSSRPSPQIAPLRIVARESVELPSPIWPLQHGGSVFAAEIRRSGPQRSRVRVFGTSEVQP